VRKFYKLFFILFVSSLNYSIISITYFADVSVRVFVTDDTTVLPTGQVPCGVLKDDGVVPILRVGIRVGVASSLLANDNEDP
jgi:hypothetical protein